MESLEKEVYDLLILVDATYSMSDYLESLQLSLPKVIAISTLTDCFARIGLLAYRDYCDKKLIEWSGWLEPSASDKTAQPDLISLAKLLDPLGGGDYAEATKTGLAKAYQEMRPEATTIILVYTDAPPHSLINGSLTEEWSNLGKEKKALNAPDSYGGYGPLFSDWVSASNTLHSGEKRAQVFCILEPSMAWQYVGHYNYLSTITRGACIYLKNSKPLSISEVTVEMLLAWMGVEKAGTNTAQQLPASLSRYINVSTIKKAKHETDPAADTYFAATKKEADAKKLISKNITEIKLTTELLKKHLPKKKTPLQDFAKRYTTDQAYKAVAVEHLRKIIDEDVSAVSLNPVFGSLWRAVCNDRNNPARDGLIAAFGLQVERIAKADEKTRMKTWLEESYDYTADVLEAIGSVPQNQRFPCVLLDPTLAFVKHINEGDDEPEEEDDRPITEFRRDELLEIGRSCDYRILRRLGRVLTRLTFVESADDIPAHIAKTADKDVPKIPMALAFKEHGRRFWRILLHIVVPGTMLAARPAALLAALSIRLGVQPLLNAADTEMLSWKNQWNNLEIPETWNISCLSLLLDADQEFRCRMGEHPESSSKSSLLKPDDRALFERLVEYKMLELNLTTHLTALIGWTPQKTSVSMGPIVRCRCCKYPRSVTVMGINGRCGPCSARDYKNEEEKKAKIEHRVSATDNEATQASWVECFNRKCRAQYVVYNVEALNVRAKCHYCRYPNQGIAPKLECTQCLNRVIYPDEYRPKELDASNFICYACTAGRKTIVGVETNANTICKDGDQYYWLLRNSSWKITAPFTNRSLFHTINTAGTEDFTKLVTLFPANYPTSELRLHGKTVQNAPDLIKHLKSFISRRRTESVPCSLCFSDFRHSALRPACGRSGCTQRICASCLQSWYGLNGEGRIINTAALFCPFCRRAPAAKTLAAYGQGIHAVGELKTAVEERGTWIHAWCIECGHARRFVQRVCARGAPAEVQDWMCEDCEQALEAMESANEDAVYDIVEDQEREDARYLEENPPIRGGGGNRAERGLRAGYTRRNIKRKRITIKKCPRCGTNCEKDMGCNHVSCPVATCGVHWCWQCRAICSEDTIYDHMDQEHGGFFGAEIEDGDDGVEDLQ